MTADIDGGEIREPGDDEAPMFAAAPVWERNRKRRATRGHGSPAGSRTALLAGAAVVLGLGFAGAAVLYATQDRGGVPELAPGAPEPSAAAPIVTAQAPLPLAPAAAPVQTAEASPAPEPVRRASAPKAVPTPATRQHAVVGAASAESSGVNAASRSLPGQPVPYSNLGSAAGDTASQPAAPGPVNPPAQAAPAIPQTPPVLPQESAPEIQPPSATPPTAAG